jgi:hypothetical protein
LRVRVSVPISTTFEWDITHVISFFFPLSSSGSLYKAPFCVGWIQLKNGVVLLTSYIPRIAVTLLLQLVFVITNRIKCCSCNEINLSISSSPSKFVTVRQAAIIAISSLLKGFFRSLILPCESASLVIKTDPLKKFEGISFAVLI